MPHSSTEAEVRALGAGKRIEGAPPVVLLGTSVGRMTPVTHINTGKLTKELAPIQRAIPSSAHV